MSGFEDMDDEDIERYVENIKIWKEIGELRKKGKSYKEISEIVGWSTETVRICLKNERLSPKNK